MVSNTLKVGDIFEDGGRKYKVLEVKADGSYISTATFEEEPKRRRKKEEE